MAILNNSNAISSGGYDINNSLRFRSSASAYLSRTPASAGNRRTYTFSAWVKRGSLGTNSDIFNVRIDGDNQFRFYFNSSDQIDVYNQISGTIGARLITTAVYRDPSAWYHIVLTIDTTNATAGNRMRLYVNESEVNAFGTDTQPSQNYDTQINTTNLHSIGNFSAAYFDGYLADVNFIDGQALTPSSFGETDTTTGVWKPKAYTGTYGTNGFYLKFSDIATTSGSNAGLGKDFSGNANYWTTNNISVTAGTTYDAMIDSPTLTSATVANYAVLNPLDNNSMTLSAANLDAAGSTTYGAVRSSIAVSSGKYYFEVNVLQNVSGNYVGIAPITSVFNTTNIYPNALAIDNSTIGGIKTVGVTIDFDNLECKFYVNNVLSSTQTIVAANAPYAPFVADGSTGNNASYSVNFGQRPFSYTPPTGFVRLNTYNLPDSTIKKGNTVMDATTYTGTGSSLAVVNAAGFKPDFVWGKDRAQAQSHLLFDSVRGVHNFLSSNSTSAESTNNQTLTGFNSNGFQLGTNATLNQSGISFVGWQWQAGQGSTSSNTAGSITSTVSVNTTAGFSVVTYTGTGSAATIGHGLGVAPRMIITKQRNAVRSWGVYHVSLGAGNAVYLDLTNASAITTNWNSTTPTSSVFSVGNANESNASGGTYVAYCWAAIPGYSAFTSYTGNGSADGPFIFLGFRPKFIMIKRTDSTGDWYAIDSSRATYNQIGPGLNPNTSSAEFTLGSPTGGALDFLSNGFKWRGTYIDMNASGGTYIVAAWAENPFKNSNAR